jgi:hypothetical protein
MAGVREGAMIQIPKVMMSVDAECRGLYGEAFAIGWVIYEEGKETSSCLLRCPLANAAPAFKDTVIVRDDDEWLLANVVPTIPGSVTHSTPVAMRDTFWDAWVKVQKRGGRMLVDCGSPVEAHLLRQCVTDDWTGNSKYLAPMPLLDVACFLEACGMDGAASYPRLDNELPAHNPVNDARQSARLFFECVETLRERHRRSKSFAGDLC